MEWGQHWLVPLQDRLKSLHPELSSDALNEINDVCQTAMRFGFRVVTSLPPKGESDPCPTFVDFRDAFCARYPWVSTENLSRLFSQGIYYARK